MLVFSTVNPDVKIAFFIFLFVMVVVCIAQYIRSQELKFWAKTNSFRRQGLSTIPNFLIETPDSGSPKISSDVLVGEKDNCSLFIFDGHFDGFQVTLFRIRSPRLRLPEFKLFPKKYYSHRVRHSLGLKKLTTEFTFKVSIPEVKFQEHPGFAEKYSLFFEQSEGDPLTVFTPEVIKYLCGLKGLTLDGKGQFLQFYTCKFALGDTVRNNDGRLPVSAYSANVKVALRLVEFFERAGA